MNGINSIEGDKGSKILRNSIIIIAVIIILILLLFVILYFCTDLLKTDKQLFFKYVAQLVETKGEQKENNIQAFYDKKQKMPYENEGKFDFTIDLDNDTNEQMKKANDFVINFSGKNDKVNNKTEQNIELKYSEDVSWPLIYMQDNDIYGVQTDYVSSKYVAIENNNLKELAEKIGIKDVSSIPDKIQIPEDKSSFKYTEEEKKTLKEKYVGILENQLRDDQFKRENNEDGTTKYILTITNEELKNLIITILNELKTDDITLGKINNILSEQNNMEDLVTAEDIDSLIKSLEGQKIEEGEVQIIVTQKASKLIGISLNQNENNIQLTKSSEEDNANYIMSINLKFDTGLVSLGTTKATIYFSANYSGLKELNNVKESYELGIITQGNDGQQVGKYTYKFENTVNFVDTVNIEGLSEENAMILNNYEEAAVQNFMIQLGERISDVNTEQMEKIGFNYGNPMFLMIPTPLLIQSVMVQTADSVIQESDMSGTEIQAFNSKLLKYGGNQRGNTVKSLIQEIEDNNINEESQVALEFADIGMIKNEELSLALEYIIDTNNYEITFEYDSSNKINKVIIAGTFNGLESSNEGTQNSDNMEKAKNTIMTAVNQGINNYNTTVANGDNNSNDLFTHVQENLKNLINSDTQMMKNYSDIKLEVMDNDSWLLVRITNSDGSTSRITVESNGYISEWMDR